jgi:hypothetical protein
MKLFLYLTGTIIFFYSSSILSTTINGRFTVLSTGELKFTVLVQINTNTGIDDLGGATVVISFDTNSVNFPNVPVKGEDYIFNNFDGGQYSDATVTKPMKNKIWVNIDLPFTNRNNGTIVAASPNWTNVVTLNFVVKNENIDPGLSWQLSSTFWGIYDADNNTLWQTGTFEGNFGLSVEIKNGWNLVSVPGINPDGQGVNNWWPGKNPGSSVFIYSGGYYEPVTTTQPGEGYWMNHIGNNIYNTGDEWPSEGIQRVPNDPINVSAGWNAIGGYEKIIQINQITTTPPGLISGPVYTFSDHYVIATTIEPGIGYIVNLTGPGQINYINGMIKEDEVNSEYFKKDWGKIIISDNSQKSFSLYLVNSDINLDEYELPPVPPEGLFDVRFGSGRIAERVDNEIQPIIMNGVNFPAKIKVENINIKVQDESGKIINADLNSGEEITITNQSVKKLLIQSDKQIIPNEYFLSQNYPNPFNPSTTIKFAIPNDADVNLSIFNVLGELVTTLVDKNLNAGQYEYEFDAHNLSSGIYIYRIKANDFVETKKMVLLR